MPPDQRPLYWGPPTPPTPRRPRGGPFAVIAIVVGCVLGLVVSVAVLYSRQTPTPQAPPPESTPGPAATPTPTRSRLPRTPLPRTSPASTPTPTRSYESSCPTREVAPVVPGWKAIGSQKDRAAFDVPSDFPFDADVLFGQESKNEMVLAHCATYYQRGACGKKSNSRGTIGLVTYGSSTNRDGDPVKYAENWARISNTDYQTDQRGPVPAPTVRRVRTLTGAQATVATIDAADTTPDKDCPAPRFRVTVVGIELPEQRRAVLVIDTDRGTDNDLPDDVEQRIITSLRPL